MELISAESELGQRNLSWSPCNASSAKAGSTRPKTARHQRTPVVLVVKTTARATAKTAANSSVCPVKATYMPAGTEPARSSNEDLKATTTDTWKTTYPTFLPTRTGR